MFWAEAIGRTVEVPREILHCMDIGADGVLSVVATLELVQHHLAKMGHSDLLVTQNLHGQQGWGRPRGSVRRASGLVQTRIARTKSDSAESTGFVKRSRLKSTSPERLNAHVQQSVSTLTSASVTVSRNAA